MGVDWRANISGLKSLDDVDPYEMMIYLRHQYFSCAKDLFDSDNEQDAGIAVFACQMAEALQVAIDFFEGNN